MWCVYTPQSESVLEKSAMRVLRGCVVEKRKGEEVHPTEEARADDISQGRKHRGRSKYALRSGEDD